jgi:hypothetical protein
VHRHLQELAEHISHHYREVTVRWGRLPAQTTPSLPVRRSSPYLGQS